MKYWLLSIIVVNYSVHLKIMKWVTLLQLVHVVLKRKHNTCMEMKEKGTGQEKKGEIERNIKGSYREDLYGYKHKIAVVTLSHFYLCFHCQGAFPCFQKNYC